MLQTQCRYFNGYKPCGKSNHCSEECEHLDIPQKRLLIIHLGALGAVVRSSALLKAMKKKYPSSHITWVTDKPADQILRGHPLIDRVLTTTIDDLLALTCLKFDVVFCIDKGLKAIGILKSTQAKEVFGFVVDENTGAILPASKAAEPLWLLGLNDHEKFFVNKKSEIELCAEALELTPYWQRDEYFLPLSLSEDQLRQKRRQEWLHSQNAKIIVGFNTGCSHVISYKKLTVEAHRQLIDLLQVPNVGLVLLGGPEDTERNQQIAVGKNVVDTPTNLGLRDGMVSVAACDIVITGDSLGMHMAIAQKKYVYAWFGPTCAHEIELYDRGEHILTQASCAPCWKRSCDKNPMCYDQVDLNLLATKVKEQCQQLLSSKQLS